MSWTMPTPPDQLIQLLRRQSPMAPAGAVPPPGSVPPGPAMAFGPQPTPQTVASNRQIEGGGQPAGIPPSPPSATPPRAGVPIYSSVPRSTTAEPGAQPQTGQPSPAAAPPSDDPSISPVHQPPDVSSYLNPAMQRMNDLMAKRAAVPGIDPNQVKPKWWERALAVGLGATQLRNPENAANVADMVVHRRLYGAERTRNLALQPIDEQIKAEREAFPLYTAAGEAAYRQAELGQHADTENRERFTAKTSANYKTDWNQIRQQRADDQAKAAADRDQQQKDSLAERERRDQETNQTRQQLADIRDRLATDKENKPGGEKRGTPGQFSGVEVNKQQALSKAHSDYQKAVSNLEPDDLEGHKQAATDLAEAQQQAQDAYEQEIISLGGTAQHFDYGSQGKARPNNAAQSPGASEKVNELGGRKVGDVGVVRGQRVRITNIYKNGKFDYEPATGR
jgi:hypothetical protein